MTARAVKTVVLLLPCLLFFAAPPEVLADYYKYKDSKGAVCITNKLESVPPKYRAAMQVVRDQTLAKEDPAGQKEQAPAQAVFQEPPVQKTGPESVAPAQATSRFAKLAARYPWFKPLAIVGGVCIGFAMVMKLAALLPSAQFSRLLYLAFFVGVFVFAYKSYADHVAGSYLNIKQKVLAMFVKANEREGLKPAHPADAASEVPAVR